MKKRENAEIRLIFFGIVLLFAWFLVVPILALLLKSFQPDAAGNVLVHYMEVFAQSGFWTAFGNSFRVAGSSAAITTLFAFVLAYTVHYTNLPKILKKMIRALAVFPMFLPTITYGSAILYSFGKQGMLTKLLGKQLFEVYGFNGLLLGYFIYTLPVSFLLIHNAMGYIDKKFMIVSRVMGDGGFKRFWMTILRPLIGTLTASFVQCFFLAFTDFGIPTSVGGQYEVAASVLYDAMLGSLPDFHRGAVVALMMLVPSVVSIAVLYALEKYNVRYNKISVVEIQKNPVRDTVCGAISVAVMLLFVLVFCVIFLVPFVREWPYEMHITLEHVKEVFRDRTLFGVLKNSVLIAVLTAVSGCLVSYGAALVTARSRISEGCKRIVESIALVTNTIPGMVIGIAFMLMFSGTSLQNTFLLIIVCNVVHYFSTPYLMIKGSLEKMNGSWETTAMLMGDNWMKTIFRVVTPNVLPTIIEVFSYYFVNAMVTVSAVIFISGTRTMVITAKVKELQHFAKFNEIFVLSVCILVINIVAKLLFQFLAGRRVAAAQKAAGEKYTGVSPKRKGAGYILVLGIIVSLVIALVVIPGPKGSTDQKVVIYSNADDEAVDAMKETLDANGYKDQYIFQTFGTSELSGKMLAEGAKMEADVITMSSFYIDSAQEQNQMFLPLQVEAEPLSKVPEYAFPITSQEGVILVNTRVLKERGLAMPQSLKDLSDPIYAGEISVTDIKGSTTAWLMIQALISEYGETEAKQILTDIYKNAGPHMEDSGSGPLKKIRSGEVAIGFGLRHQAIADKEQGLPVDYVDPVEGNFSLTESVAVVDKGADTRKKAMEMAACIIEQGRAALQNTYPNPLYKGEREDTTDRSAYPKTFEEPLTAELLNKHQEFSESCKP